MIHEILLLIGEMRARQKSHRIATNSFKENSHDRGYYYGKWDECDFVIPKLESLLNEQPEAITEDSHLRKHDVGRIAASEEITTIKNDLSESSSETQAVGQNEQTKEVKKAIPFGIAMLRAKQHYRNSEDDNIPF